MEPRKTESDKVTLANYVEIDKTQAFSKLFSFLPKEEHNNRKDGGSIQLNIAAKK
jgi:xylan 1,4-beta-xylosidase